MIHLTSPSSINNLIWLGVSQSAELDKIKHVDHAILVSADAEAITLLKKQQLKANELEVNINLEQCYLSVESDEAEFYQYNLTEFSALSKISGLQKLFPGLKLVQTLTITTTAIADFITGLSLNERHCNVLRLDIIDQALPMLKALESSELLDLFDQIQVQSGLVSLYQDAATASDIKEFLATKGYVLKSEDKTDLDLPVLHFVVNELWRPLQQSIQKLEAIKAEKAEQTKVLTDKATKLEEQLKASVKQCEAIKVEKAKEVSDKNIKLDTLKNENEVLKTDRDEVRQEHDAIKIKHNQIENQLNGKNNLLSDKLLQLNIVQKKFNDLNHRHIDLEKKHALLVSSLTKAEAQIEIIKNLLIKPSAQ